MRPTLSNNPFTNRRSTALEEQVHPEAKNNFADLKTSLTFSMNKIKGTVDQKASSPAELATELTTVKYLVTGDGQVR